MPKQRSKMAGSCPFILTDNEPCEGLTYPGHTYCPHHEREIQRHSEQ